MVPEILNTIRRYAAPILNKAKSTTTGKVLSKTKKIYKNKGFQEALGNLEKYKNVTRTLAKDQKNFVTDISKSTGNKVGRAVRTGLGNFASTLKVLSKDLKGSGVDAPFVAGRNLFDVFGRNIRSAMVHSKDIKDIDPKKLLMKDGKYFYKGKKILGFTKLPNEKSAPLKEVIKAIQEGRIIDPKNPEFKRQLIIRSGIPGKTWGLATSAPVFAATQMIGNKEDPMPKRVAKGMWDATKWSVAPGLTTATEVGVGLTKYLKNKKKLLEETNNGIR